MPYVARNNVAECCVEMLRAFAGPYTDTFAT